jgi:hypothetical protein
LENCLIFHILSNVDTHIFNISKQPGAEKFDSFSGDRWIFLILQRHSDYLGYKTVMKDKDRKVYLDGGRMTTRSKIFVTAGGRDG